MNQSITLHIASGETDKYGKDIVTPRIVKARVERTSRLIEGPSGNTIQASLEVDLPADIPVSYGQKAKYEDGMGITEGTAQAIDEAKNLAGTKTYYRTVYYG